MKLLLCILFLIFTGCSSPPNPAAAEPRLIGTFCHASIDATACLTLKADFTYSEDFNSGVGGIPSGPRDHGRWESKAGKVFLFPSAGSRRVLTFSEQDHILVLTEAGGSKFVRTYRR